MRQLKSINQFVAILIEDMQAHLTMHCNDGGDLSCVSVVMVIKRIWLIFLTILHSFLTIIELIKLPKRRLKRKNSSFHSIILSSSFKTFSCAILKFSYIYMSCRMTEMRRTRRRENLEISRRKREETNSTGGQHQSI